ncbi:MAG: HD domain-containing protein [Spirochaetia bacterium]|nr:HD domain-containing protein [Spirochaetia bacterium]
MKLQGPENILEQKGYTNRFSGITALDLYYRHNPGEIIEMETDADLITLSTLFDVIEFPGEERIDAVIPAENGQKYYVRILDDTGMGIQTWKPLQFYYSPSARRFFDTNDMYPQIRHREELLLEHTAVSSTAVNSWWYGIADAAVLAARYGWPIDKKIVQKMGFQRPPTRLGIGEQRIVLMRILESQTPGIGLQILMESGFIKEHWPLVFSMQGVVQDKDYHPEGDVWDHTVEMFNYSKKPDPDIGMGILLHDCGKAFSQRQNNNEFDMHAQIGARKAAAFLRDLNFSREYIKRVEFLINSHMLPAYLPGMPVHTVEHIMTNSLFPKLLEIYRCDISSSYRDPEGYYRICEHYRKFQKHRKNPFRTMDGKVGRPGSALGPALKSARGTVSR